MSHEVHQAHHDSRILLLAAGSNYCSTIHTVVVKVRGGGIEGKVTSRAPDSPRRRLILEGGCLEATAPPPPTNVATFLELCRTLSNSLGEF